MMNALEKRRHHFERRCRAAREGRHLPTLDELVRGSPFMSDSLIADAQAFAERFLGRFDPDGDEALTRLQGALQALTVSPSVNEFRAAQSAFLTVHQQQQEQDPFADFEAFDLDEKQGEQQRNRWMWRTKGYLPFPDEHAVRCALYAASSGYREAAWIVAAHASAMAIANYQDDGRAYATATVAWLSLTAPLVPSVQKRITPFLTNYARPADAIRRMLVRVDGVLHKSDPVTEPDEPRRNTTWFDRLRKQVEPEQEDEEQEDEEPEANAPKDGVKVITVIGNAETSDGRKVVREFERLTGKRLPLVDLPDLAEVRRTLIAEFPYAAGVIDSVLTPMATADHVRMRPTILVGDPGCGKTTFAERLFAVLGVRSETYSCGGVSDSALSGTPRRWSTGEPALPVALIRRWETASPAVILDEIEKTATSRHNGHMLDGLLGLLEPRSSVSWHDPYVEAPVDVSHVMWLCTANSMDGVPGPLRDRCRIIPFPSPGPADLDTLAPALLRQIVADRGLDARWYGPLDGEELDALREVWPGGSVRALRRLVEGVLDIRGFEGGVQ